MALGDSLPTATIGHFLLDDPLLVIRTRVPLASDRGIVIGPIEIHVCTSDNVTDGERVGLVLDRFDKPHVTVVVVFVAPSNHRGALGAQSASQPARQWSYGDGGNPIPSTLEPIA